MRSMVLCQHMNLIQIRPLMLRIVRFMLRLWNVTHRMLPLILCSCLVCPSSRSEPAIYLKSTISVNSMGFYGKEERLNA